MFPCKPKTSAIIALQFVLLALVSGIHLNSFIGSNTLQAFTENAISSLQQQESVSGAANDNGTLDTTNCPANITEVARQCYGDYMHAYNLNLDALGRLPPFTTYYNVFQNSDGSLRNLCRSYNNLHSCIESSGSFAMSDCMNVNTFKALSLDTQNAIAYLFAFATYEYSCIDGYEVIKTNNQCFVAAKKNSAVQRRMNYCEVTEGRGPGGLCKSTITGARCDRRIFTRACGEDLGVATCKLWIHVAHYLHVLNSICLNNVAAECSSRLCMCYR